MSTATPRSPKAPTKQPVAVLEAQPGQTQTLFPYDANRLVRARTQLKFGDWQSLFHYWGGSEKLINQILIAGVNKIMGRADDIGNQQHRALQHFENAIAMPILKMHDQGQTVVINTTPLIALSVATSSLDVLRTLYNRVIITFEVQQEILAAGHHAPGVADFLTSGWLERLTASQTIPVYLQNTLDRGEASVIQAELALGITRECIDEKVGRRIARRNGLNLTGSIGILFKAKQASYPLDIDQALLRLHNRGVWLGKNVGQFLRDHT